MAEPMFKKAGNLTKRVPKWAWYVSGGVAIAAGIYYFRSRQVVTEPEPGTDTFADEGMVGYTDASQTSGIIVPPVIGGEAVPAEINTDIPTATLDIFGGLISDLITQQPDTADILQILAGAGGPQQGANAGGVVTAAPPTPRPRAAPKPKPNPCSRLEGGYHCSSRVDMGPNARKTFPGAKGWARTVSGGKGKNHFIDVHVRFCTKLERWRVYPNRGNKWSKVWSGSRSNICG